MVLELVRPGESHQGDQFQSIAFRKDQYKIVQGDITDSHCYYEPQADTVATSDETGTCVQGATGVEALVDTSTADAGALGAVTAGDAGTPTAGASKATSGPCATGAEDAGTSTAGSSGAEGSTEGGVVAEPPASPEAPAQFWGGGKASEQGSRHWTAQSRNVAGRPVAGRS